MKNKRLVVIAFLVLILLIIPIPFRLRDGGSIEYKAILYSVTKIHRLNHQSSTGYEDGWKIEILGAQVYNEVDVYVESIEEKEAQIIETINTTFETYHKMSNGTWRYNGNLYKYKLEVTGRMPNAVMDSTFVYLSNIEDIPFERAYLAAGLSSSTTDYFSVEEAVLVDYFNIE